VVLDHRRQRASSTGLPRVESGNWRCELPREAGTLPQAPNPQRLHQQTVLEYRIPGLGVRKQDWDAGEAVLSGREFHRYLGIDYREFSAVLRNKRRHVHFSLA
jgi:hypothetical protein